MTMIIGQIIFNLVFGGMTITMLIILCMCLKETYMEIKETYFPNGIITKRKINDESDYDDDKITDTERYRESALSVLLKTGNFTRLEAEEYLNKYDDGEKFWVYNKDNNSIDIYFKSLAFGTLLGLEFKPVISIS